MNKGDCVLRFILISIVIGYALLPPQYLSSNEWVLLFAGALVVPIVVLYVKLSEVRSQRSEISNKHIYSLGHRYLALFDIFLSFAVMICCFAWSDIAASSGREAFCVLNECKKPLSKVQAIYFATVTISTTGYGDIAPQDDTARLLISCQIWLAMISAALVLANLATIIRYDFPKPADQLAHAIVEVLRKREEKDDQTPT
jgi:hypothetical protein